MKYIIVEIQVDASGNVATLVNQESDRLRAESIYHQVLAAAAVSQLSKHGAVLMSDEGFCLLQDCYKHGEND